MIDRDLFGEPIAPLEERSRQEDKRAKRRRQDKPKGYAAPPGSGPAGETCKSCAHSYRRDGGAKTYRKCDLVKATKGPGSDILFRSPACSRWEPKDGKGA